MYSYVRIINNTIEITEFLTAREMRVFVRQELEMAYSLPLKIYYGNSVFLRGKKIREWAFGRCPCSNYDDYCGLCDNE